MKIKIPITDQFLWMIYEFFEKTEKNLEIFRIFEIRSFYNVVPLGKEILANLKRKKRKKQFAQFINYLKTKGYIKIADLKGKKAILLTPFGKRKALRLKYLWIKKKNSLKKRKDGKWIMIIFDIPERKRRWRDELRNFLYSLGFQPLQKSIWVSPYDVLDELKEIIATLSLDKYVRIFLIEEKIIR